MSTNWKDRYSRSRYFVQKAIREYGEKPALKAYLEIFLTLVAISLFGIFAIRPTVITIGKLLQEIKAKESTLKTMNNKIESLKIAKDLYTREEEKIKLIDDAIPKQPKPENLTLQIQELAKKDAVFVNKLTVEDTYILSSIPPGDDQALSLSLGVSGDYLSLFNFASDLENLRRPIKYDGLTITSTSAKDKKTLLMTLVNLSTPYLTK